MAKDRGHDKGSDDLTNTSRLRVLKQEQQQEDEQLQFDPWRVSDEEEDLTQGYDVSKFYVKGSDTKKGQQREHFRVYLQPHLADQIAELIASKNIPQYRTVGDMFRDAMFHRLTYLREQISSGELKRLLNHEMFKSEMAAVRIEMDIQNENVRTAQGLINDALSSSDRGVMERMVGLAERYLGVTREPYRSKIQAMIDSVGKRLKEME